MYVLRRKILFIHKASKQSSTLYKNNFKIKNNLNNFGNILSMSSNGLCKPAVPTAL